MKTLTALLICAIAVPAFALTTTPRPGDRIGILWMSDRFAYGTEQTVANAIQNHLRRELHDLGFKAFEARITYDDLLRRGPGDADFYVEVVSAYAAGRPVGAMGAAIDGVAVEVGVLVSNVAAEVRLYDGRSLNLVESYDLAKKSTAVVPTGIGIAGRSIFAAIMLPFVEYGQFRSAAHEMARQAALRIAGR